MKILRLKASRQRTLVQPQSLRERVILYWRGWRPAELLFVPVEWWEKPEKPNNSLAILIALQISLGVAILALIYTVGLYINHEIEHYKFLKYMQEQYPPRR